MKKYFEVQCFETQFATHVRRIREAEYKLERSTRI